MTQADTVIKAMRRCVDEGSVLSDDRVLAILARAAVDALSPASPPAEALPSQTSGAEAGGETYRVVKVIHGEVSSYQPGTLVKARDIHNGKAVVTNMHGMGCIVGVPMDRLALAKPASEPAGGGVDRERIELACESINWIAVHQPPGVRADLERLTASIIATLSSPASSSPAEAEALQAGVEAVATINALAKEMRHYMETAHDGVARLPPSVIGNWRRLLNELTEASLSSAPAQEDGSKDLGAHPRVSGQNSHSEGA